MPSLHRTHHSTLRTEHDSNYGAVLSVWDRLFGTLKVRVPRYIGVHGVHGQGVLDLVRYGSLPSASVRIGPYLVDSQRRVGHLRKFIQNIIVSYLLIVRMINELNSIFSRHIDCGSLCGDNQRSKEG